MSEAPKRTCNCDFCKRHRKYKEMCEKVQDKSVKEFFESIYHRLNNIEADLEYEEVLNQAYRKKYGFIGLGNAVDIINEPNDQ